MHTGVSIPRKEPHWIRRAFRRFCSWGRRYTPQDDDGAVSKQPSRSMVNPMHHHVVGAPTLLLPPEVPRKPFPSQFSDSHAPQNFEAILWTIQTKLFRRSISDTANIQRLRGLIAAYARTRETASSGSSIGESDDEGSEALEIAEQKTDSIETPPRAGTSPGKSIHSSGGSDRSSAIANTI